MTSNGSQTTTSEYRNRSTNIKICRVSEFDMKISNRVHQ